MNWKTKFETVASKLEAAGIKCRLRMSTDEELYAECGWNYPEEMAIAIWDAVEPEFKIEVVAEVGTEFKATKVINGGPQRHSYVRNTYYR
jgi:hypothetical protein